MLPALFDAVLAIARKHELLSEDHFSVDGTLIDAWASHKSFRPRGDEGDGPQGKERDYRGEKRSNATHVSRTDPESELMRKGKGMEARLRYGVHPVVENRNHLVVALKTAPAATVHEREAALDLLAELPGGRRRTVGGDNGQTIRRIATHDVSRAGSSEWCGDPDADGVQFAARSQSAVGVTK